MAEPARLAAGDPAATRFLSFGIDQRRYALPATQVAEVMRIPALARVPQSPRALLGIANLRGAVMPVVGLREMLGLTGEVGLAPSHHSPVSHSARAIVLEGDSPVAFVVDGALQLEGQGAQGGVVENLDIHALLKAAFVRQAKSGGPVRAKARAVKAGIQAAAAEVLVSFEVAGQEYALAIDAVQEILSAPDGMTRVPTADAVVLGVTTVRDRLLPLLSLRALLGFQPAPADQRQKVVVARVGGAQFGLVADRARAVVSADAAQIDEIPAMLAARAGGESRIRAIYRGEGGRRLISILTPEKLFREDIMQRLGNGGAAPRSVGRTASTAQELKFLVFRLNEDEFALPIEAVNEVSRVPAQITRVPGTPKFLEGVVNLRGEVLPVVDQRRRFDMPSLESVEGKRLIVIRTQQHSAGLIVDSVSEVLRVSAGTVAPAPELTEGIARLVRGVINLEAAGRMLLVLDPAELLTPAERRLLDEFRDQDEGPSKQ